MNTIENYELDRAETLALKAIQFILADEKLEQGFMVTSGVSPADF